jgi:hypothetical protein
LDRGRHISSTNSVKLLFLPFVGQDIVIRKVKADTAAPDQLHGEVPY